MIWLVAAALWVFGSGMFIWLMNYYLDDPYEDDEDAESAQW